MTRSHDRRSVLRAMGAGGLALTAGLAGCSSPSESTDSPTDEPTDSPTPTSGGTEEYVQTNTVDMTDDLTFEPPRIEVEAGTTVTWENVGAVGHTVTAYEDEIPDGADYWASGGFDSQQAAQDGYPDEGNITEGGTYEHTFETTGEHKYYCIPHEMNGMVGWVKVV